jgi:1-acyl-sn-glycerol-3-phosphate acyltransferase
MRKNIYDKDWGYNILKPIVDWNLKHSYRKVEVRGKENIPTDGAVIIAPNHCNTLMDALVILRAFDNETVFGARADMFNNAFIAKLMYFIRILPMVRQRDGLRNVLKNYETQEIIVDTLKNKVRFCMFPEGRHRPAHSLQTLGKGTFRAALAANAEFGDQMPVYIVPAGIEYGDYFRYRSTSLVTFGKPINVTETVKELNLDNEAQVMDHLRKELSARMSELITYLPYDENYDAKWALTKVRALDFKGGLYEKMLNNRAIVADINAACEADPEKMADVLAKASAFEKARRKKGVSIYSFRKKNLALSVARKGLAAILGLPYLLFSGIVALPMWGIAEFLRNTIRDKAFRNTAIFGVKLAGNIIFGLTYLILAFCLLPWPWALAFLALAGPAYSYIYDYAEFIRRWISDIKLLGDKKLQKTFTSLK